MFDFVKLDVVDFALCEDLLANSLLTFGTVVNEASGEILSSKKVAKFGNMVFTIYPNGRVFIQGSLHKLYNHILGRSINHDVFTYRKLNYIINFLKEHFGINPNSAKISNLEFGVNIEPTIPVNKIIKSILVFRQYPFNKMALRRTNGYGIDNYLSEYGLKFYNKGLQYNCPENILRFEKKVFKMRCEFQNRLVLENLLDKSIWYRCAESLLADFNDIIISEDLDKEKLCRTDLNLYTECINPRNWQSFTRRQRTQKKERFNGIMATFGKQQIRDQIKKLMTSVINQMLSSRTYHNSPIGFTIASSIPNWDNDFKD